MAKMAKMAKSKQLDGMRSEAGTSESKLHSPHSWLNRSTTGHRQNQAIKPPISEKALVDEYKVKPEQLITIPPHFSKSRPLIHFPK